MEGNRRRASFLRRRFSCGTSGLYKKEFSNTSKASVIEGSNKASIHVILSNERKKGGEGREGGGDRQGGKREDNEVKTIQQVAGSPM